MSNAEPIVPQSIVNQPETEHQSWIDRIESAAVGLWHTIENNLPNHDQKDAILNAVKGVYDNSVKVVRDDLAKQGQDAETMVKDVAQTVVSGAENAVEDTAATLETPATSEAVTDPSAPAESAPETNVPDSAPATAASDSEAAEVPAQSQAPAEDSASTPSA